MNTDVKVDEIDGRKVFYVDVEGISEEEAATLLRDLMKKVAPPRETEFRNESGLEFIDISSEEHRMYHFPIGAPMVVEGPLKLHVSESGGHRIFTEMGHCVYVPKGWIALEWKAKEGQPHFVK
jgi:hypothetical protein